MDSIAAALRDVEKLRREVCEHGALPPHPDSLLTGLPGASQMQVAEADSVFQRAHESYRRDEGVDGRQPSSRGHDAAMRSRGGAGLDTGETSPRGVRWQVPPESAASYEDRLESFQADTERVSCLILLPVLPRGSVLEAREH